jgi:hypothetical protein
LVSPEYSARKHHVPTAVGANDGELAVAVLGLIPAVTVMALPTVLLPVEQPLTLGTVVSGPQAEKLTVPVGVGPPGLPVTVAWSVFGAPRTTVEEPSVLAVVELAAVTVKHSVVPPSKDGE